jgi:hypothetical protein
VRVRVFLLLDYDVIAMIRIDDVVALLVIVTHVEDVPLPPFVPFVHNRVFSSDSFIVVALFRYVLVVVDFGGGGEEEEEQQNE